MQISPTTSGIRHVRVPLVLDGSLHFVAGCWLAAGMIALLGATPASAAIVSTFDTDDEGWTVSGDTTSATPTYFSTGGNPGGYIQADDNATGGVFYFDAPIKFLGDQSSSYGMELTFELRNSGGGQTFSNPELLLNGAGLELRYDLPVEVVPDDESWTTYTVLLNEMFPEWVVRNSGGMEPTQAQFMDVLANLTRLRIRGEFITGDETGDLDNVVLNSAAVPEPSSLVLFGVGLLGIAARRRRRSVTP